jgi:hypothetical protein
MAADKQASIAAKAAEDKAAADKAAAEQAAAIAHETSRQKRLTAAAAKSAAKGKGKHVLVNSNAILGALASHIKGEPAPKGKGQKGKRSA